MNETITGEIINNKFGNHEDYIRARDIANGIPEFSGTAERGSFVDFEEAFRSRLMAIPTTPGKTEEYGR